MSRRRDIALKAAGVRRVRPSGEKKSCLEGRQANLYEGSQGMHPSARKKACLDGRLMDSWHLFPARNKAFYIELSFHVLISIYRMTVWRNLSAAMHGRFLLGRDISIRREFFKLPWFWHSKKVLLYIEISFQKERCLLLQVKYVMQMARWGNLMETLYTLPSYFSGRMEKEQISASSWK